ncbi:MAG: 2-hydroxyacyl-CoA dehydratase [Phyllobacteriaceae bacterium]|nr:2-hydroxyacyl-CoA dehydratase [Phyllobacteriaceae bacterium]
MPETLVAAAGAVPVHLALGTSTENHPISEIIEPFVDEEIRHFLIRLMQGAFADLAGIIFARDDAPALIAYQYATEWIRQDLERAKTPPLFLWNLVHSDTPPVRVFNRVQAEKLFAFFESIGLKAPDDADILAAAQGEQRRAEALRMVQAAVGVTQSGTRAARWRNAGRFMLAEEHADLLTAALAETAENPAPVRIGIVGSPLCCEKTYRVIEGFGTVVCDQQGFGEVWPGPGNTALSVADILAGTAADPSCHRIAPTSRYRSTMVKALVDARCTLVVCQLSQTDDTFGWEIPALTNELAAQGMTLVNLGFRDARPDDAWVQAAGQQIAQALEASK